MPRVDSDFSQGRAEELTLVAKYVVSKRGRFEKKEDGGGLLLDPGKLKEIIAKEMPLSLGKRHTITVETTSLRNAYKITVDGKSSIIVSIKEELPARQHLDSSLKQFCDPSQDQNFLQNYSRLKEQVGGKSSPEIMKRVLKQYLAEENSQDRILHTVMNIATRPTGKINLPLKATHNNLWTVTVLFYPARFKRINTTKAINVREFRKNRTKKVPKLPKRVNGVCCPFPGKRAAYPIVLPILQDGAANRISQLPGYYSSACKARAS